MGLYIHRREAKVLRLNTTNTNPVPLRRESIEDVDAFTYLGSIVSKTASSDEDIKARLQKVRNAFLILKSIWKSRNYSLQTILQLFNSNVGSVLLNGSETWRTNKHTIAKVQTFINQSCLRKIELNFLFASFFYWGLHNYDADGKEQ